MKPYRLILPLVALALAGCDTISGISRGAKIHALPDLQAVKARIETYPEVKEVKLWDTIGGRPPSPTGIKKADELFYLTYTDNANVHGTLLFMRDANGELRYSQYLIEMNRPPPQPWIDATWPVMKKIEQDLVENFGLPEISATLKTAVTRVKDPERKTPDLPSGPAAPGAHGTP